MRLNRILLFSLLICFVFPILSNADQLEDAKAAVENEEFQKAYELLSPLAEENNAEAQTLLGNLYVNGNGVGQDITKGLSLIMKAGTQGYEAARVQALNLCLELGKDGDAAALYNVGYMCLNGWGGKPDPNDCIEWLKTAAILGHIKSANWLSSIYTKGSFGIIPDKEKVSYFSDLAAGFTAGIDGIWTGTVPGAMGGQPMTLTYKFKRDGDILTGATSGAPGLWTPIRDGKVDGTKISFAVDVEFNKMKMTINYNGVLVGNDLKLSYKNDMGGGFGGEAPPITFITKRVK